MKKITVFLLLFTYIFTVNIAAAKMKQAIAIMDFQPKGADADSASIVSDLFRDFIVEKEVFIVVDRASMESILKEQNLQQDLGCSSEECAVNLGKILGVSNIVIGTLGKLENISILSVRVVNIETGKIEWSKSAKVQNFAQIDVLVNALVNNMLEKILYKRSEPLEEQTNIQNPQNSVQQQNGQTTLKENNSETGEQNVIILNQQQQIIQQQTTQQQTPRQTYQQSPTAKINTQPGAYYLYTQNKKSGGAAFMLSFFLPSAGHFYAEEGGKAFGYLLLEALEVGAFLMGLGLDDIETEYYDEFYDYYYYEYESHPLSGPLMIGGSVLLLLTRIIEVIDAPSAAERYNAKLLHQMQLTELKFDLDTDREALTLSYAFRF